ncbi:MAG: TolC family protein [Phycisphaerae bacterium]|nr:TolC family protein [Phycisphaerae bacterium]MCZ2401321.1 TolC family protein [Phycisphaerae bacterium]
MTANRRPIQTLAALALCAAAGCARLDPRADYQRVAAHVADATGVTPVERPDDDAAAEGLVDELLREGLALDEAVQVCLLSNARARAALLRVGVARAELAQAGLFRNPTLALAARLPDGGGLANLEAAITQSITDLWLLPVRRRAAEAGLEHEVLSVARELSAMALATRRAYLAAVAADREYELALENGELGRQLVEVTTARQQAGVGSSIDVSAAQAEVMRIDVAARRAALVRYEARQRLVALLGRELDPDAVVLCDTLPDPAGPLPPLETLLIAAEQRLDLGAADIAVAAAEARVRQEMLSVFSEVEAGVSFERDARGRRGDRPWRADTLWASAEAGDLAVPALRPREKLPTDTVVGPSLSLVLPIFDQNQAQIALAHLALRQAELARDALRLDIRLETRAAEQRARAATGLAAYYRDTYVPLLRTNLELAREAYRGGKTSLLAVLEAHKVLLAARGEYVVALRDAALAWADLEQSIGQPLTPPLAPVPSPTHATTEDTKEVEP